jgi:hypothetical protein
MNDNKIVLESNAFVTSRNDSLSSIIVSNKGEYMLFGWGCETNDFIIAIFSCG